MESFFEWEYRLLMFLQNSIRGPVQNKIMWCITSLENAGFLSIAACLALLLQPRYRRVGQAATVSMILEFMLVNLDVYKRQVWYRAKEKPLPEDAKIGPESYQIIRHYDELIPYIKSIR